MYWGIIKYIKSSVTRVWFIDPVASRDVLKLYFSLFGVYFFPFRSSLRAVFRVELSTDGEI